MPESHNITEHLGCLHTVWNHLGKRKERKSKTEPTKNFLQSTWALVNVGQCGVYWVGVSVGKGNV
jgi:hypothetical protein